ncbi:MAG: 2-oxoglutarate and iron-dependent oxygenase domain-containing protein [Sweet potato little leaf phytoplasma]|nr:2-oxoglutarate and iron-dependent oxygenase domain-containing protein [Sweet potato little leaf phytoplasma]
MGSGSNPLKLPLIDFSVPNLKPGTAEWESLRSEVRKALEEYGFFEALFNKLPPDLKNETISALGELFELPLQTKLRNVSEKPFYGYASPEPYSPLYESMGFENSHILEKADTLTAALWPEGNPSFRFAANVFHIFYD